MRAATRQKSLEKKQKELEKAKEKQKELIRQEKSLRMALENKRRKEERKKRTHALILLGEFFYRYMDKNQAFVDATISEIDNYIKHFKSEIDKADKSDDGKLKKLEKNLKNTQTIFEFVTAKKVNQNV